MKTLKITAIIAFATLLSCGGGISNQPTNAEGFTAIEKELKDKFGETAYYTDVKVVYIKGYGNSIDVTVTEAPESLKMGQWSQPQNSWEQSSEITIELPEGTKATDFMFQLNDKISLKKLGELVEKSSEQLTAEKDIENPMLNIAYIDFPDNGDMSKAEYYISLEPENGGTKFSFTYKLNGELIEMDY
jgi:hypothetical protein